LLRHSKLGCSTDVLGFLVLRCRPPNPWVSSRGRQRRAGLVGALGGFVLPIIFGIVLDWLGINSSCFMFLYGVVWVSLILNCTTEVRRLPVMAQRMSASAPVWHTTLGAPS